MDLEKEFDLEHLLFKQRRCKSCGKTKDLITDFYRTRKGRVTPSAYAYECKECTIKRVINTPKKDNNKWEYPDW